MKRTYEDRRGYGRDSRDRDRDRDEASYYRDPSSAAAVTATSPRASTSASNATASPRRMEENDRYNDNARSRGDRDRSTDRDRERDRGRYGASSRDGDKYLSSSRGTSAARSWSRERERHHHSSSSHSDRFPRDRERERERPRDHRERQRSAPMSPSQSSRPSQLATTVKEATPEEGEIIPPAPAISSTRQAPEREHHPSQHAPSSSRHGQDRERSSRDVGLSRRNDVPRSSHAHPPSRSSRHDDRRSTNGHSNRDKSSQNQPKRTAKNDEEDEIDYDSLYATSVAKVAPTQQKTPAEIVEEKRKARAAILARYQQDEERSVSATPQPEDLSASLRPSAPGTPASISTGFNSAVGRLKVDGADSPDKAAARPDSVMQNVDTVDSGSEDEDEEGRAAAAQRKRDEADLLNLERSNKSAEAAEAGQRNGGVGEEVSAADYDPEDESIFDDRRERERLFMEQNEQNANHAKTLIGESTSNKTGRPVEQIIPVSAQAQHIQELEEDDNDDDDDDMFAVEKKPKKPRLDTAANATDGVSKTAYIPVISRTTGAMGTSSDAAGAPLIVDNFDDAEGYYRVILGETLDGDRYHLTSHLGKGMFSNVVRARDRHSLAAEGAEGKESEYREVAIKIMRSQESMYRAGQKEILILKKLAEADPTDKKHVVRLERTFEHRGHLCLVFENLSMNLRDVIKRFGKDVGINLKAVRAYAHQIFLALSLFRKLNIMHADIKPDNILVNDTKSMLKVCDLGSAADTSEAEITPYLVSRFYRAPEIILGLPYDCSLDMWSIACTLYELYTGKILFPGRSNNHMLYLIQELKGRYPARLVKKSKFGDIHFEDSNFVFVEKAKVSGADTIKKIIIPPKGTTDLKARLMPPAVVKKLPEDEVKLLTNFVNLLERALELDPSKRLTPKEALSHPFLR